MNGRVVWTPLWYQLGWCSRPAFCVQAIAGGVLSLYSRPRIHRFKRLVEYAKCGLRFKNGRLPPSLIIGQVAAIKPETLCAAPPQSTRASLFPMGTLPATSWAALQQALLVQSFWAARRHDQAAAINAKSVGGSAEATSDESDAGGGDEQPAKRPCSRSVREVAPQRDLIKAAKDDTVAALQSRGSSSDVSERSAAQPVAVAGHGSDSDSNGSGGSGSSVREAARHTATKSVSGSLATPPSAPPASRPPSLVVPLPCSARAVVARPMPPRGPTAMLRRVPSLSMFEPWVSVDAMGGAGAAIISSAGMKHQLLGTCSKPEDERVTAPSPMGSVVQRAASRWSCEQVTGWLHDIAADDLSGPFAEQGVDGMGLQALHRTGACKPDALHSLLRAEFGRSRLGHRLRVVDGLRNLFG